jgi:hypothetical protein
MKKSRQLVVITEKYFPAKSGAKNCKNKMTSAEKNNFGGGQKFLVDGWLTVPNFGRAG